MTELMRRRRALIGILEGGDEMLFEPKTGCFYKEVMNIELSNVEYGAMGGRYKYCSELKEVTCVRGRIGEANHGSDAFSYCPKLERLILPIDDTLSQNSYIAASCPLLSEVQIGSIGHPFTKSSLYYNAFKGSGGSATSKTITIYVKDDVTLPLSGEPWGLTGATIIYRSSTTGDIITP